MQKSLLLVLLVLLCLRSSAQATTQPVLRLDARLKPLSIPTAGPFVRLQDGGILAMNSAGTLISQDQGVTWTANAFLAPDAFKIRPEHALIRTRSGVIVCIFINDADKSWKWDAKTNNISGVPRLFVYAIRSTDEGKTWSAPAKIQDGYCGAIRHVIQSRDGTLILPSQIFLMDKARHATVPMYSSDDGATWHTAGLLDIEGRGHHDGLIESCVVEKKDGQLWMLLRSNHDVLYESFSRDSGRSWSAATPTKIDASSSPAMITRLQSGRLILVWNKLYADGTTEHPRRGGQYSTREASWQREQLVIALSNDDGATWSDPQIVARTDPGKWIAYPFVFETSPGIFWLTTMQSELRAELREADFVSTQNK